MKFFLAACLLASVAFVVMAEDVFFHDRNTAQIVWRSPDGCYVMTMTQEQQDKFAGHDYILVLKQLMRDLAADPNHTSPLPTAQVTDFITHHCHNHRLLLLTQPTV